MKNKKVKYMLKSIDSYNRLGGKLDAALSSLYAGGGEANGRNKPLECWIARKDYYERGAFIGFGDFAKGRVKRNAGEKIQFDMDDGSVIFINRGELRSRIEIGNARPDTGDIEQRARAAMYSLC